MSTTLSGRKLTVNGMSTTTGKDTFAHEPYNEKVQWDYRDSNGTLYSGVTSTIEQAKEQAKKHGYVE